MTTELVLHLPLEHPQLRVRFGAGPRWWLPHPARPAGIDTWQVELFAGPVHRTVLVAVGTPWEVDGALWRAVRWEPVAEVTATTATDALLPVFVGELGLTSTDGRAALELRGTYQPPGGALGRVADRALLHRVGEASARRFLDEVARRLVAVQSADAVGVEAWR